MEVAYISLLVLFVGCALAFVFLWRKERSTVARQRNNEAEYRTSAENRLKEMQVEITRLAKWAVVADADDKARQLISQAKAMLAQAEVDARILLESAQTQSRELLATASTEAKKATADAQLKAGELRAESQMALATATSRAAQIIDEAHRRAEEIAGKAIEAVNNAELYERTARAMKNIVEGYGDEYLVPAESLLDDLAEEFAHKDAGQQLKLAREQTKRMTKSGQASKCDYVEITRKEKAEQFVLDAFNGKIDSILSRVKHDNYGKLAQEIDDAFTVVNYGGKAFREARITEEYLNARLDELKWATIALELKRQEQEEQRRIRELIRDEEKARREYERAIKDAAKEEEMLRKAMSKAQAQIDTATQEQKAKYESQLAELNIRLQEAEERNQRALSMAQQTRRGHVYIISNVGSFGEDIYKVGLTRRLEPQDRIKELGDASVPFDFDVHAIILSDDAPKLETQLHKHFVIRQVNKVNHRKEFFRATITDIRREIETLGIEAKWTMTAEAREFRETKAIERAIENDPKARQAWINRQLTLDPVVYAELTATEDEG